MTDLDQAREHMQDIIAWWPLLDDVADTLIGVTGYGVDLAGVHTTSGTSATELAVIQLEEIQQISIDLTALAKKMGYRPGLDGTARHYVHANLAWARANLAAAELDPIITDLHNRIAKLTGHAPRPTGRTCPACGESQLHIVDEGLHCDTCAITRHPDEVKALTSWRITTSTLTAPAPLVAHRLGIPTSTIRTWIARGHLTRQPDGTIHIPTARTLATRDTTLVDPHTTM